MAKNTENNMPDTRELGSNFAHLHVHTEYSLLDGANRIKPLIARVKELGMDSIAITDHGNMYGVIDFYKEATKEGINPIIGCEVYLAPKSRLDRVDVDGIRYYHLILLAENNIGYKNLVKLVSLANIEGMYYKPRIDKEILRTYSAGLICLSACIAGEIPVYIRRDNLLGAEEAVKEYIDIFGKDNFFLEMQNHGLPEERKVNPKLVELAKKYDIGLVATNDAHYLQKEDNEFHEILLCVQTGKTISDPNRMVYGDSFYIKSPAEMAELFPDYPEAIENAQKIAKRCRVKFDFKSKHLPNFLLPDGMTDNAYLHELCEKGLPSHYPEATKEVRDRLAYELDIIHRMGFDSYFLIVWDFINYAKGSGIAVGPGRGSAAGSIVAYILGITDIDPLKYDLLFERFLNPERVTMPDIDVDFCYVRRGEVIEYVKRRYGDDHVAQIATFGTMAAKNSIRDVGRALDMPYGEVNSISKLIPNEIGITIDKALKDVANFRSMYESNPDVKRLIDFARGVEGLVRHASTHAAGVVIARNPLTDYMPVSVSDGTLVTQYDKDHVEGLGLLKMDFLGLKTLTVIADTIKNIEKTSGKKIDLREIPLVDKKTAKLLCQGKTSAVFQMESAGMTALVKDLKPEGFVDLIPTVALYRPGPLGSGMVEDFIKGRAGQKKVEYMHPLLEPILKETFGVVLYQEQVMQIVQVLAGFTLGQADLLRRAMGKKKHSILMEQKEDFLKGTKERGLSDELANHIFDLLTHFADYGFNKSHSAAYALVAWQTAYLKAHYPAEFMAAMLTSKMDTNDKIGVYIEESRHMGIEILPPDINASTGVFSVDGGAIRFGLAAVKNAGESTVATIIAEREKNGVFTSLVDFCTRIDSRTMNKRGIESLIKCGAFDTLGVKRSQLLEILDQAIDLGAVSRREKNSGLMSLFEETELKQASEIKIPEKEEVSRETCLAWEKEITGFYITGHPLDGYKSVINSFTAIDKIVNGELADGKVVKIGGLIVSLKRTATKKGDTMCFMQVEDFQRSIEVVVFPRIFYECIDALVIDSAVMVQGKVNITDDGAKIIADKVVLLSQYKPSYYLLIDADKESKETTEALKAVFSEYHGNQPVFMYYPRSKRTIKANEAFWLNGDEGIIAKLEEILGKGNVKTR